MDAGHLIAINVVLLYLILGPLVLFAIYVLFDSLVRLGKPDIDPQKGVAEAQNPALWTEEEVNAQMDRI